MPPCKSDRLNAYKRRRESAISEVPELERCKRNKPTEEDMGTLSGDELQHRDLAEPAAVQEAPAQQEEARGRERPRRSVKKVNYGYDLPLVASVPGVPNFYIAENLRRSNFKKAGIQEVVTVGDSRDLPYEGWQGRVDFRFPDGDLNESDLVKVQAAKQHCIAELLKGKAVAVHCAAGVNRSSLVAVLVMQDMNERQAAQEAIQSLTSAKLAVNPSWLTWHGDGT